MRASSNQDKMVVKLASPDLGYVSYPLHKKEHIITLCITILRNHSQSVLQLPLLPVELWFIVLEMAGHWYKPFKSEVALSSLLPIDLPKAGLKEIQVTAEQLYRLKFDKNIFDTIGKNKLLLTISTKTANKKDYLVIYHLLHTEKGAIKLERCQYDQGEIDEDDSIQLFTPRGVTEIGDSAFYKCENLTELTLPAGLTSIGAGAFYWCTRLAKITLPAGLTSIGAGAFHGCVRLTQLTLPAGVTEIGQDAFNFCESLTQLTLPASMTSIGEYAFTGCARLAKITLLAGVAKIAPKALYNCSGLKKVFFDGKIKLSGIELFKGCYSLEVIVFADKVTNLSPRLFEPCSSLQRLDISDSRTTKRVLANPKKYGIKDGVAINGQVVGAVNAVPAVASNPQFLFDPHPGDHDTPEMLNKLEKEIDELMFLLGVHS